MIRKYLFLVLIPLFLLSCQSSYPGVPKSYHKLLDIALEKAGENAPELASALEQTASSQKEGMAYLIAYMPQRDLESLSAGFLLENVHYAYLAKEKYPWCRNLPDSIFLNEVLPYANISEERDPWRKELFELFSPLVEDSRDITDAIFQINRPINKITGVEYNTLRSKVDLNPRESMDEQMATCTGLSILLTDAFRSVGIPSRLAGTPMWTNYRGNHTWTEVWIDGQWKFTEYYPDSLDKSWFLADAGKADPENMMHWIYAVSYKPTGLPFYAVNMVKHLKGKVDMSALPKPIQDYWAEEEGEISGEAYIHGVNVTQRYIDLYRESLSKNTLKQDEIIVEVAVYENKNTASADARLSCRVEFLQDDKRVDFGYSPNKRDDLNRFLQIKVKKGREYKVVVYNKAGEEIHQQLFTSSSNDSQELFIFLAT